MPQQDQEPRILQQRTRGFSNLYGLLSKFILSAKRKSADFQHNNNKHFRHANLKIKTNKTHETEGKTALGIFSSLMFQYPHSMIFCNKHLFLHEKVDLGTQYSGLIQDYFIEIAFTEHKPCSQSTKLKLQTNR